MRRHRRRPFRDVRPTPKKPKSAAAHRNRMCGGAQTIDKPSEGYGEVCNLPIFNQIWRHVRQSCIFREQTPALVEKNEYVHVRKFVCEVREFPRVPFSLNKLDFSTN